jgi:hypothetical protein
MLEAVWYILWSFGEFSSILVHCTKENLAALFIAGGILSNRLTENPEAELETIKVPSDRLRVKIFT